MVRPSPAFCRYILNIFLQSAAFDFGGLLTARIGLGTFEAGFSPVAVLYLS